MTMQPPSVEISQERARIARDLHDGLAADLVALGSRARRLAGEADAEMAAALALLADRVQGSLRELRQVVWALRSPDRPWGLFVEVLRERVEPLATDATQVEVMAPGPLPGRVEGDVALSLLRVAQEAVANAVRHARATRVEVRLTVRDAVVTLAVLDDGCGIPEAQREEGGLVNLSRRAAELGGELRVLTGDGGTTVLLAIPA
jgi:signal transduction histidine kinase